MNIYLRVVGFSNIDKRDMSILLKGLSERPDKRHVLGIEGDEIYVEYYKNYGKGIGLIGLGNLDEREKACIDICKPYVYSDWNIEVNEYFIEYIDETPVVIYEDPEWENDIIFELQDTISFIQDEKSFIKYGVDSLSKKKINVAGLSLYGTVILPILKDNVTQKIQEEENKYYKTLITKSKAGDEEAIELLTLYEEQSSDIIRERLKEEDFLSVVEGYLLPTDDDALSYSILGDIEDLEAIQNYQTNEEVYKLSLSITGIKIQIYINKRDITGLPMKGMRFMGVCKLQGKVIFDDY